MREIKDWRKNESKKLTPEKLTPEKLMEILTDLYGEDLARKLYHKLTGHRPPEVKDDVKNTTP